MYSKSSKFFCHMFSLNFMGLIYKQRLSTKKMQSFINEAPCLYSHLASTPFIA
uniref:Uncharacterized protein n=1 Tax=Anguilla anguilla TaxID=7936 RepID=A0A0E9PYZ9_ANGAN